MSKPTVSKHITTLEKHLGARLLRRTTRTLGLTEIGANFYAHCQKVMAEIEAAEVEVLRSSTEPRGTLRISAPTSFGCRPVALSLSDFQDRYPDIKVELALTDRIVDLVTEGFDLAVRIAPSEPSGMGFRLLAPCVHVVCAAPGYCERHGTPEAPLDLRSHNCLIHSEIATGDTWELHGPDGPETVRVTGRLRTDNGEALRLAVLAGFGLALLPTLLVDDDLRSGRLRNVLPAYRDNRRSVYAVWPYTGHVVPKTRACLGYLELWFSQRPPEGGTSRVGPAGRQPIRSGGMWPAERNGTAVAE